MTLDERRADQWVLTIEELGILLVEDESFTRKLIARMLSDLKVRSVYEASDGLMALDLLRRHSTDINIIICDLEMPRMGGLDLLHALRTATSSVHADSPVIVLTAHSEADTINRAIAYGIIGYLVKPVSKGDLVKQLSFALRKMR